MELIDNLCDLETSLGTNIHHEIMALSGNDTSLTTDDYHQPQPDDHQLPINFTQHIQSFSQISDDPNHDDVLVAHSTAHLMNGDFSQETGKGKSLGGRKRKNSEKDGEKLKEVIHVRAKRGQATDSHSLAERLRREKINERLRCLQNLVPGCYKTMGMAVMLDVVCSYVQSLQNQIEFLSMKLSAASAYYDFNTPGVDAVDAMQQQQGTSTAYPEVQEMVVRSEGYGGLPHYNNATWPISDPMLLNPTCTRGDNEAQDDDQYHLL